MLVLASALALALVELDVDWGVVVELDTAAARGVVLLRRKLDQARSIEVRLCMEQ